MIVKGTHLSAFQWLAKVLQVPSTRCPVHVLQRVPWRRRGVLALRQAQPMVGHSAGLQQLYNPRMILKMWEMKFKLSIINIQG